MLKSVLSAAPTYSMSCFELPAGLCDQIQAALTRFWWDSDPSVRKICWVSWDSLSQHKDVGGLGFRDIRDFNTAMLAKNAWRILTSPDCLLARLLLGKYCHSTSFLTATCPSSASHGWRGILSGCRLLKLQLGKAIGNGNTTKIWSDSWISPSTYTIPFGPPTEWSRDLYVSDLLNRGTGDWNHQLVETIFPELAHQIYLLKPSLFDAEDSFCWHRTKTGTYSVKSGYYALRETSNHHQTLAPQVSEFDWQKFVWRVDTAPKQKVFLWKLVRGALPLGSNLQTRGIETQGLCPHCLQPETAIHLFFSCPFARQVWDLAPLKNNPDFSTASSIQEAFAITSTLICLPPVGVASNVSSWLLWFIWTSRNLLLFEDRSLTARATLSKALSSAREWRAAQATSTPPHQSVAPPDLILPSNPDIVLCNTDAAWRGCDSQAGLGWWFDDRTLQGKSESSRTLERVSSPLMAEALAMREAMQEAKRKAYSNVWFRTDSQELVRAVNSKTYPVELFGVLMDIEFLSSFFTFCCFSFVSRDLNTLADSLAKSALLSPDPLLS